MPDRKITILITELVGVSLLVGIMVSDVFEVETLVKEFLPWLFNHFLIAEQCFQYAPVFNECIVDVSDNGVICRLELIVMSVATIIIAELLICPSV
jgi:hypothetical protein